MRKSQNIRTYAFLLHDFPMKFSPILPFLTRFRKKRRVAALQLDLRRNATRCTPIIAEANQNFKCFSSQILVPAPVCAFANVAFAICTFFRHLVLLFCRMADAFFFLLLEGVEPICLQLFRHAPRQLEARREAHQL